MADNREKKESKPKKNHRVLWGFLRYFLLILVIAVMVFLIWWFFSTRESETYVPPTTPVQVSKPTLEEISETLTLSSYVEAEAMIPVVPFVSGNITEYNVYPGKRVEKDELIAQIDPAPYLLQVSAAEAQEKIYQSTYERIKNLYDLKAATQQELEEIKAQLDASKAQLELANIQLGYASVKSPVSGTVLMAPQTVGDIGSTQSPLAIIADIDSLKVVLSVPEKYFSDVNENRDHLKIRVIRPESNVSGEATSDAEILSISPYIDPTTKTFEIEAKLKTNVDDFRPGMYVKSEITFNTEKVYALPISALKLDNSVYYVEYEPENESYIAKYLKVSSPLENDMFFEIGEEWKDTEFIVRGQNSVLSGQKVEVVEGF